ncbi:acyl-CoA dehydrogenase [Nocardiopsis gilva YIM 90087]|uniref:Acyl-CoA dehydrogenase n=1 Tax=Nocardiopsis gilva YIM 90087 TaxID=1235441 RepID=A0A223SAD6_9ACTN|nr:acyl-CoA dehydrogenase family protein [Nocardiopsis gilva]ASU85100.1 acyl-CoA dehydrogenase [Nocardiopsis gilva YIM 90087]
MSTTETDLLYSEVEEELRDSVRGLLTDKCPASDVLARVESDEPTDTALWKELCGLGVAGLPIPEAQGGAGASWREAAVVAEELGRAVAPVPFLGSAVLATAALLELGDTPAAAEALGRMASGESTVTLAVPLATLPAAAFPDAVREDDGGLTGTVAKVADAATADALLVPALSRSGPGLYLVAATDTRRTPLVGLDLTRSLADIGLDRVPARCVASGPEAERALRSALVTGAAVLASEQLGVAQWALDATVDYVKTRTQFGRPVGSFQAVKHRIADLWVSVSQARAVVRNAASAVAGAADDAEGELSAAVAQAFVSRVAVTAAEEAVQLHGGIGFTWEHPAHLYLKRAKSDAIALGTADRHRLALSRLVDLPVSTA